MEPIAIEEDGYVDVTVGAAAGRLDLYQAYNRLREAAAAAEADPAGFGPAVAALLAGWGLPGVSERAAVAVAKAVFARVEAVRGKDSRAPSPTPASAGSTGSPSET